MDQSRSGGPLRACVLAALLLAPVAAGQDSRPAARSSDGPFPFYDRGAWGFKDAAGKVVIEPRYEEANPFYEGLAAVRHGEKWGFVDITGRVVIEPRFAAVGGFSCGRAWVKAVATGTAAPVFGYVDREGRPVIATRFYVACDFSEGLALVYIPRPGKLPRYGFIDPAGEVKIAPQFCDGWSFSEGLARVRVGTKWGYVDATGKLAIEPQFEAAMSFVGGLAGVQRDGRWGYVEPGGRMAIPARFDAVGYFHEDRALAQQGERVGFLDRQGRWAVQPTLTWARDFCEGIAAVNVGGEFYGSGPRRTGDVHGGLWGYVDKDGRTIVPPRFVAAGDFHGGVAEVSFEGKPCRIDRQGRFTEALPMDEGLEYSEGLAPVRIGGRWGYADAAGRLVVLPQFKVAGQFSEGLAPAVAAAAGDIEYYSGMNVNPYAERGRLLKWGYVDKTGAFVIPPRFDKAGPFRGGLARVVTGTKVNEWDERSGGKFGFVDRTGRFVVEAKYEQAADFSDGLALVRVDGKSGYVDKTGRLAIAAEYAEAGSFSEGLAAVAKIVDRDEFMERDVSGKFGYIDRTGKTVIEPQFDSAGPFREGRATVGVALGTGEEEDRLGLSRSILSYVIDTTGRPVVGRPFVCVGPFGEGLAPVRDVKGLYGYADAAGKLAIPIQFSSATPFSEGVAVVRRHKQGEERSRWTGELVYIDKTGKTAFPPPEDGLMLAEPFSDGLAAVTVESNCGYIDKTGRMVIPNQYREAGPFHEGVAWVSEDFEGRSLIDKTGKPLAGGKKFPGLGRFAEGLAPAARIANYQTKWGYVDKTGAWVIQPAFDAADSFYDGIARVRSDSSYHFINRKGERLNDTRYDEAGHFAEGFAPVRHLSGDLWGFLDTAGKLAIEGRFQRAEEFSEGKAMVVAGGMVAYVDKTGRPVAGQTFTVVSAFSEGLALVRDVNGRCGYVDKDGKLAIACTFVRAHPFSDGLARVQVKPDPETVRAMFVPSNEGRGGPWGFIDSTGKLVIEAKFPEATDFHGGRAVAQLGESQIGYIDKTGEFVLTFSRPDRRP